jgi:hypothetical protein
VQGYAIEAGMIYVGDVLIADRLGYQEDPALVIPSLAVDRSDPDRSGSSMPYWPSYSTISPKARAAYLDWLAGGRVSTGIGISHVFLFFYGLERRVLEDAKASESARAELPEIAAEVRRLLDLYGENGSFRGYASSFLSLLDSGSLKGPRYEFDPPDMESRTTAPLALQVGLGQAVRDGKPIPPAWALAWLRSSDVNLRTPAHRCAAEFEQLFGIRYLERYGKGLVVSSPKSRLRATYHPASAAFSGAQITVPLGDLPDITGLRSPLNKFHEIAESCCTELEPYSRWRAKQSPPDANLVAAALLPEPLAATHQSGDLAALETWLRTTLGSSSLAEVKTSDLVSRWPAVTTDQFRKQDAVLLAQLLQRKGYGVEPDVRFAGPLLADCEKAVLFRLSVEGHAVLNSEYARATVLLHLAALVAAADGSVSPEEMEHLTRHLETSLALSLPERTRLHAHLKWSPQAAR